MAEKKKLPKGSRKLSHITVSLTLVGSSNGLKLPKGSRKNISLFFTGVRRYNSFGNSQKGVESLFFYIE